MMIHITFRQIEKSELAKEAVIERMETVLERFPDLKPQQLKVRLVMENSPQQAGPDLFKVQVRVRGGRYDGLILDKAASNLYEALALVVESLLERLNRFGDRSRVKDRQQARKWADASQRWREP